MREKLRHYIVLHCCFCAIIGVQLVHHTVQYLIQKPHLVYKPQVTAKFMSNWPTGRVDSKLVSALVCTHKDRKGPKWKLLMHMGKRTARAHCRYLRIVSMYTILWMTTTKFFTDSLNSHNFLNFGPIFRILSPLCSASKDEWHFCKYFYISSLYKDVILLYQYLLFYTEFETLALRVHTF